MKILHIIDNLGMGGAQKLIITFSFEAQKYGMNVTVLALTKKQYTPSIQQELESFGARVIIFDQTKILTLTCLRKVVAIIRQNGFSIIHSHLTYANIVAGLASMLTGVPLVATLHNVPDDARLFKPLTVQLERWVLRFLPKQILAVGEKVAQAYEPILHRKLVVIPNAVRPPFQLTEDQRSAFRTELVGDPTRPICIAAGRLSPAKGFDDLIDAFATVCAKDATAMLIIAGSGGLRPEIEAHIGALGLESRIKLLGERQDVPRLLSIADIYLSASHWEGLPLAHLEAMISGLPVVATSVGEVPRIIIPEAGLLVPPHQPPQLAAAILKLLADPSTRKSMGCSAHAHALQNYSSTPWFNNLLSLYSLAGAK